MTSLLLSAKKITLWSAAILIVSNSFSMAIAAQKKHFVADSCEKNIEANSLEIIDAKKARSREVLLREHDIDTLESWDGYRSPEAHLSAFDHAHAYAGKDALKIQNKDYALTLGGSSKIENYFQKNVTLLNSNLPDESFYFKHTFDLTFDYAYGEKTFGHKAINAYLDMMHKGVWGKNFTATEPARLSLSDDYQDTNFGDHKHTSSRPFLWFREAWLNLSLNAIVAPHNKEKLHFIKLGWFPFVLGRGISYGPAYGSTRDSLGLYSAMEDKCAPGINISGELIKDSLLYDVYYSMLECHSKGLGDTLEAVRYNQPDCKNTPWRGVNQNNQVIATRLKFKPKLAEKYGSIEIEPYAMYNDARDQSLEMPSDSKAQLGTFGLSIERTYGNFECGGEVAMNVGKHTIFQLDRNVSTLGRNSTNGALQLTYSKVTKAGGDCVVSNAIAKAANATTKNNESYTSEASDNLTNSGTRMRANYDKTFKGFMGLVDAAYTFPQIKLRVAGSSAYVSGDQSPLLNPTSGKIHSFIGTNEWYSGTRVKSVFFLDDRSLQRPIIKSKSSASIAGAYTGFNDLVLAGISGLWTPTYHHKKVSLHANAISFWQDHKDKLFYINEDNSTSITKYIPTFSENDARRHLGIELNSIGTIELLKDLNMFIKGACFIPGGYFTDMKGLPMKPDALSLIDQVPSVSKEGYSQEEVEKYRLNNNIAWHINTGLTYKF